jgi:hypothetical protein
VKLVCGGNPDLAPLPNVFKFQRFLDTLARFKDYLAERLT